MCVGETTSGNKCTTVWKHSVWVCVGTLPQRGPLCNPADYLLKTVTTWLRRVQPQRKRSAKFRVLSFCMLSSNKVFLTSLCFPCEIQTLLVKRNAFMGSGLGSHIVDGGTRLIFHFVPGRWYRSPRRPLVPGRGFHVVDVVDRLNVQVDGLAGQLLREVSATAFLRSLPCWCMLPPLMLLPG